MDPIIWIIFLIIVLLVLPVLWNTLGWILTFVIVFLPSLAIVALGIFIEIKVGGVLGGMVAIGSVILAVIVFHLWNDSKICEIIFDLHDKMFPDLTKKGSRRK